MLLAQENVQQFKYDGYQNTFPLDDVRSSSHDVGNVSTSLDQSTKKCSNLCSIHNWCGAFYLSSEYDADKGKCHLVLRDDADKIETLAIGPGHVYYRKETIGDQVSISPMDPVLIP
eukprot:TCALIF_07628-PA protein Name:"Protein of unknown function" AED:0.06 eAED:0.06 QI:0/1/0.33/1/0.5/0.33/3/0/115